MDILVEVFQKVKYNYNQFIPLLDIYPKDSNPLCTSMFTATLFTITRKGNDSLSLSVNEWVMKMWYVYTMEF